jgi:anaphase-promoting complex subunit 6
MCHLRGVLYMRLNRAERAKNCFLEALALDVKCFESFNTLIQSQMLTVEEGETSFAVLMVDTNGAHLQNGS